MDILKKIKRLMGTEGIMAAAFLMAALMIGTYPVKSAESIQLAQYTTDEKRKGNGSMIKANSATISGHLGKDPVVVPTKNGRKIAFLNVAVDDSWKNKETGQWNDRVVWIDVQVTADFYIKRVESGFYKKGEHLYIEGVLTSYTKEIGDTKVNAISVSVAPYTGRIQKSLKPTDGSPSDQSSNGSVPDSGPEVASAEQSDDDIPF